MNLSSLSQALSVTIQLSTRYLMSMHHPLSSTAWGCCNMNAILRRAGRLLLRAFSPRSIRDKINAAAERNAVEAADLILSLAEQSYGGKDRI
jgi:hypothetical protein